MMTVDMTQIKRLQRDLKAINGQVKFANAATLNGMAFTAQKAYRTNVREQLVNRNNYTEQSIRVERTRAVPIPQQQSKVGSIAPYMDEQEFGGESRPERGRHKPIPTNFAAERGYATSVRTSLVSATNQLGALHLARKGMRGRNRKQKNAIAVSMATRGGRSGVVYLDLGRRKGLFRVSGSDSRAAPKSISMLYDLTRREVTVPRKQLLYPAVRFAVVKGPEIAIKELQRVIKRQQKYNAR